MTEEFSILDLQESPHTDAPRPAFYLDLNLNQILDKVTAQWNRQVRKLFLYFPRNKECETYRREVYGDVKRTACYEALCTFWEAVKHMEEKRAQEEAVNRPMQKSVWHLWTVKAYCDAFGTLFESLSKAEPASEGMKRFLDLLGKHLTSKEYLEMRDQTESVLMELQEFRFVLTYDKDRIVIAEGTIPGDYEDFMEKGGDADKVSFKSPFSVSPNLSDMEQECLNLLATKRPKLFRTLDETALKYQEFGEKFCFRFIREIPYYLSFRAFQLEMEEKGYVFCAPTAKEEEQTWAQELYDLALAIVADREGRKVICNDTHYKEGESFFVLTGPNQGGKTTFARSLGQLVFFAKMGFDVSAKKANVRYYRNILTHFSVEESIETGRGKLKEELLRLSPMMLDEGENNFVVINELFTTAATYDAEIMGKKVLTHFIDRNCQGIYVTHLKELASVHPQVVSLRAMLDADRIQTFEIARSEAEESACAASVVNKYRLTYEQLKERL